MQRCRKGIGAAGGGHTHDIRMFALPRFALAEVALHLLRGLRDPSSKEGISPYCAASANHSQIHTPRLQWTRTTHFAGLKNFSFSRQTSSINSVSTTMRCFRVTIHGFV